jgi:hypothetical protein
MKLRLAFGLAVVSAAMFSATALAQRGLATRQVGHAPPSGLGNYGNVGMPSPPPYYGRDFRDRGTTLYLGYRGPSQLPANRPQLRYRGGYGGYGGYPPYVGGWSSGLIEDPERYRDAAYFAGPADSWHEGGRPYYDYDRGYPYDWYRDDWARTAMPIASAKPVDTALRCEVEGAGVRVCRGRR